MKYTWRAWLGLILAHNAQAADWVPLTGTGAKDQYFYDRSKLTIKDDEITYWKKVVFLAPQTLNGKETVSGLLRERIHCGEHTVKLVSYLYYGASGEIVEYVPKDESEPAAIIPDSVGDAFERVLCPMVWRKQEEMRIKAEQKAAQAELNAAKKETLPAAQPVSPPAAQPAPKPEPGKPGVIIQKQADKPKPVAPLPMPQILDFDQLY